MYDTELSRAWEEHEQEGLDRPYKICDVCGAKIYEADDTYEADDYYECDDLIICNDCFYQWAEENLRRP